MNTLGRFLALVVVFAFFAIMVEDGTFYTPRNLENIARQSAVYATAAHRHDAGHHRRRDRSFDRLDHRADGRGDRVGA